MLVAGLQEFKGMRCVSAVLGERVKSQHLVYGGDTIQERTGVQVLSWPLAGTLGFLDWSLEKIRP